MVVSSVAFTTCVNVYNNAPFATFSQTIVAIHIYIALHDYAFGTQGIAFQLTYSNIFIACIHVNA